MKQITRKHMKTIITDIMNEEQFDGNEWISTISIWSQNEFGIINSQFELTHEHKIQNQDKNRFRTLSKSVGLSQKDLKTRIFNGTFISIQ